MRYIKTMEGIAMAKTIKGIGVLIQKPITYKAWDFLLHRQSVVIEYPSSGFGKYWRILGGDQRLHEITRCQAIAGILKAKGIQSI